MRCPSCGNNLSDDAKFCANCGTKLEEINYQQANNQNNNKPLIIVIIVLVGLLATVIGMIAGYIWIGGLPERNAEPTPTAMAQSTATPVPTATAVPSATMPPVQHYSDRPDLYSSALTYKRMPDIHNTVLTSDATFYELKSVIENFNRQCERYMNGIDGIPSYLLPGSTAYNQQTEYKKDHPNLTQVYESIDVINTREGNGYYYVWVTEVLHVFENGSSKTVTDHWVYELKRYNGQWYINDYTSDPYF